MRQGAPAARSAQGPQAKKPAERRLARRVRPTRSARLIDISPGGLTLETETRLEKDRLYELVLRLDDHRMPVAARVLRLRRSGRVVRASLVFDRILESDRRLLEESLVREVAEHMTVILR